MFAFNLRNGPIFRSFLIKIEFKLLAGFFQVLVSEIKKQTGCN